MEAHWVLAPWADFFGVTAASAASLAGLMFVVITLVFSIERARRGEDGLATFSTPTVLHFASALFVSAIAIAPWRSLVYPCVILALAGLYWVAYIVRVMFRAKRITEYTPDLEDWIWYTLLPLIAYGALFVGAVGLVAAGHLALFVVAFSVLLLIFIGIRNAWDVVTYLATHDLSNPN